ncbi:hypothetical protein Q427_24080 [Halomonas sp. BC04]|nr:hypothetical protein Q427_24080 [Halomonas sp. BC04]
MSDQECYGVVIELDAEQALFSRQHAQAQEDDKKGEAKQRGESACQDAQGQKGATEEEKGVDEVHADALRLATLARA